MLFLNPQIEIGNSLKNLGELPIEQEQSGHYSKFNIAINMLPCKSSQFRAIRIGGRK